MTRRVIGYTLALATIAGLFVNAGWTVTSLAIVGFVAALIYGYIWVHRLITCAYLSVRLIATGNAGSHIKPSRRPAKHGRV